MHIRENVSLRGYSTMRLGGQAAYLCDVENEADIEEAVAWADERHLPLIMIGGGSNIIWKDEGFNGLILVNKIKGFSVETNGDEHLVSIGAGEEWDHIVEQTVNQGLTGIEALSLIPGTAGATPVQNVGAYGQEIADTLVSVKVYDTQTRQFTTLPGTECGFGYRTSRFKTSDRGRFFITSITLRLHAANPQPPFYKALDEYLTQHAITTYTPQAIRQAVIAIRSSKLPDPAEVANNGSFFANPIVPQMQFDQLKVTYPDLPGWPGSDGQVKIAAAWLVEQAGFKNKHDQKTGMATWPKQCLVLVNEHAEHTHQLLSFKKQIVEAVQEKFGITLEQEPEVLPQA